jgi:serine protease Do
MDENMYPDQNQNQNQQLDEIIEPDDIYVDNPQSDIPPVYFEPIPEPIYEPIPEPMKPKKRRWLLKFVSVLVLVTFVTGIAFGSGFFIAYQYGDELALSIFNIEPKEEAAKIQITQVQPVYNSGAASNPIVDIVEEVGHAIVTITNNLDASNNRYYNIFGESYGNQSGSGSGVIFKVDEETLYILTNQHVIDNAATIEVTFADNTTLEANLVGYDSQMDLAVLSIPIETVNQHIENIVVASFGDSSLIKAGETAIALGSPLGLSFNNSVTVGVISATNRTLTLSSDNAQLDLIQTDAAINPGNSGGALVNGQGQVIGINTAKYSDESVEGMGFAIPINNALPIIERILSSGAGEDVAFEMSADRPFLGVNISEITNEIYEETGITFGVYITGIFEGSAADKAGIEVGDVIYMLNGRRIASPQILVSQLGGKAVGDIVELGIIRGDEILTVQATLTAYSDVVQE